MEKILKRPDGKLVKIIVNGHFTFPVQSIVYALDIQIRMTGKRKWIPVYCSDDYAYRRLGTAGRKEYEMREFQKHATPDEIYQATKEYWETLAPPPVPDLQDVED